MDPARSGNHGMYGTSMRENREIPPSPRLLITGWAAQGTQGGTPEMHERGKSDRFVVPAKRKHSRRAAGATASREQRSAVAAGEGVERVSVGQAGTGSGGHQGLPVRAAWMPARTSAPCLRMVSM